MVKTIMFYFKRENVDMELFVVTSVFPSRYKLLAFDLAYSRLSVNNYWMNE